ncbi:MAG: NAD(P)/FAD-dependent oxidoreductase [Oscillospiraceae bacterium]|nr:NAD(P)/FAD-dependent oxidoreductase [Oscillospiraceae bacterium]
MKKSSSVNCDVIIIGGGVAGFAFASFLNGKKAVIIEKNVKPLQKLSITGKGRCNLTNNCDVETVLRNIPKNPRFMRSTLTAFPPEALMVFMESCGVPLKTERGGRVFPVSDKAGDVVNALKRACNATQVVERAIELIIEGGSVKGVKCNNGIYRASNVVIATGGMSYPATGSTGDGYEIAKKAGHTITELKPALVPLETVEDCSDAAGLSLKNVRLSLKLKSNGKLIYSEQGEMLFTHFGISGPLVLTASCYIDNPAEYTVAIDLKPALDEKTLDKRILRDFALNKNCQLKNAISGLLPEKLIPMFMQRLFDGNGQNKRVCEITKEERRRLLMLLKEFTLTVTSFRPIDEAIITDGGVSVKEIEPRTMQSKLVKGLYFAGEVIDVNGFTGGFNLQIAFSTAYAAANSIIVGQF